MRSLAAYRRTLDGDVRRLAEDYRFVDPRARWSASAAWAPAPGSCFCSAATTGDPLFLQAKEAEASVLEGFAGKSRFNQGAAASSRGSA